MPTTNQQAAQFIREYQNALADEIVRRRFGFQPKGWKPYGEPGRAKSMRDQGIGIPPDMMENLFKPFQQGRRGTQGEKSPGLGLAIVKRIVEGYGGIIWLESKMGEGTTFFVSIPFLPKEIS